MLGANEIKAEDTSVSLKASEKSAWNPQNIEPMQVGDVVVENGMVSIDQVNAVLAGAKNPGNQCNKLSEKLSFRDRECEYAV